MRVTVNIHHSVGKCKLKPQWDNNYKLTRMISISKTNKKKNNRKTPTDPTEFYGEDGLAETAISCHWEGRWHNHSGE